MPWTLALGKIIQNKAYFTVKCRMCMLRHFSHAWLFATPWTVAHQDPWEPPGKNTGAGCHFLLPGESSQPRAGTHISYISCIGRQASTTWEPMSFVEKGTKEKNRIAAGSRLSIWAVDPHNCVAEGKLKLLLPTSITRADHILTNAYLFHTTIKSKHFKSNQLWLGDHL